MTISEHLRRYIAENNLSFRSLAARLEMSYAHLNAIANGRKKASVAVKTRIAYFLGIPVEQLDNPDRRVVQIAVCQASKDSHWDRFLLARLWSDGSVSVRDFVIGKAQQEHVLS